MLYDDGRFVDHSAAFEDNAQRRFAHMTISPPAPTAVFNRAALKTLDAARAVCEQRGSEYLDSWHLDNQVTTFVTTTLKRFGVVLTPEQTRLVVMAALVDVKDSRMLGPWKNDTVLDGVNYRAAYATLRDEYEAGEGS